MAMALPSDAVPHGFFFLMRLGLQKKVKGYGVRLLFLSFGLYIYSEKFNAIFSVAEPHHFYAALAPGKNFDAAPGAPAPAPTLLFNKAKFLKRAKV
jgi:hypothetical protein